MTRRLLLLPLILGINTAFADGNSAMTFAAQAGSIAGAAQACGQDVSEFNNRVNQALAILADTTGQITQATQTYQTYLMNAAQKQAQTAQIPCAQVIKDYNGMPIMQPGYEQNVLEQLRQSTHKPVTFLPTENPPGVNKPSGGELVNGGIPGATNTSSQGGIPNTPGDAAMNGIPNTPTDFTKPLIKPSTPPSQGTSSILGAPTQFQDQSSNTVQGSAPPATSAGSDMSYGANTGQQPTTAAPPSSSTIPAMPQQFGS